MEPPYCKICDHNHYGVAHVWKDSGKRNRGSSEVAGEVGGEVSESEGSGKGDSSLLQRKVAEKGVEPKHRIDPRSSELLGTRVHPKVQEGGGTVSGKEGSVKVSFDRVAYQREYMRKRRLKT